MRLNRMAWCLSTTLLAGLAVQVVADVYPAGLSISDTTVSETCETLALVYYLNEDAEGDGVQPGVRIEVLDAASTVVRTVAIARQQKGRHTFAWDGRNDAGNAAPNGTYSVRITAADYGFGQWTQTSDDNNAFVSICRPVGIAVNTDASSPLYGRVYVCNSQAGTTPTGRTTGRGLFALAPDLSDALGYDTNGQTGGVTLQPGTLDPWKIEVGQDGFVYSGTWWGTTTADGGTIRRFNADLTVAEEVLAGLGESNPDVHGINQSSVIAEGSLAGGDLQIYAIDQQLPPSGSLQRWDVKAGPLPHNSPPAATFENGPLLDLVQNGDLDRGPDGKFYLSQFRSATTTTLAVLSSDGSTALFDSRAASGGVNDLLSSTNAIAVSRDGSRLAAIKSDGTLFLIPLNAGIPNLEDSVTIRAFNVSAFARDVAWDAAGNVYVTMNNIQNGGIVTQENSLIRVFSPPTGAHSNATTSGLFTLNKSGSGGPTISGQPAAATICPDGSANFSVMASGAGSVSYQWYKNGAVLVDGPGIGGATTAALALSNVPASDDGAVVTVRACDSNGVRLSQPAALNVGPAILKPPAGFTSCVDVVAEFSVIARGTGTLSYQWQKNGQNVGTNSPNLSLTVGAGDEGASITCIVTDSCDSLTAGPAIVTLGAGPTINDQPESITVFAGEDALFDIQATGSGELHYRWTRDGADVGTDSPTLTLNDVSLDDDGVQIVCEVSDDCGLTSSGPATLTVDLPPCNDPFADAEGNGVVGSGFGDGDVDLVDFAVFQRCFTGDGPSHAPIPTDPPYCACFDRDQDADIDGNDLGVATTPNTFAGCADGPSVAADAGCDD